MLTHKPTTTSLCAALRHNCAAVISLKKFSVFCWNTLANYLVLQL